MLRHHNGSGRSQVVHPDWQTHHAPVAVGTMPGTVSLRDPAADVDGGWDPATEQTVSTPAAPYFLGPCRVLALNGQAANMVQAGDPEVVADYLLTVPRAVTTVVEGHQATVTATGDPTLDGRRLRVERVARGTHRFERDLFCTLAD